MSAFKLFNNTFNNKKEISKDLFNNSSRADVRSSFVAYINHDLYLFIMSISLGIVCQGVAVFGVITNVLNIIIFVKQGFSETINISLLALALSDLLSLVSIMWSNICYTSEFRKQQFSFDPDDVQLLTGGWTHVIFTRTTGWITAFISFERCLCVIRPLKVKNIFTPKRHVIIMLTIFTVTIGCASLAYVFVGLGWKFYAEKNKTLLGVVYHLDSNGQIVINSLTYAVNGVFMPISSFLTLVICTAILVFKLNKSAAWRESNSSAVSEISKCKSAKEGSSGMKSQRVAKMVVILSIIFVTSFIPAVIIFIAGCMEPQLSYFGRYKNIFMITLSVSFIAEVINSSTNIFIYVAMSTRYRLAFQNLFRRRHSQRP